MNIHYKLNLVNVYVIIGLINFKLAFFKFRIHLIQSAGFRVIFSEFGLLQFHQIQIKVFNFEF